MVFTYVDGRHPVANHDAYVWDQSEADYYFRSNFLKGKRNTWVLGDSCYKLQPYIMTPYRNQTESYKKSSTKIFAKRETLIERCIGALKNRFRCIIGLRELHYSPEKTTKIINTCCALHNICVTWRYKSPINVNI